RAAPAQLARALRHHACPVHVLGRESPFPTLLQLLANPVFEILDGVAADAKFDQMKRHVRCSEPACDKIIARIAPLTMREAELILRRWGGLLGGSKRRGGRGGGSGARPRPRLYICLRRAPWRRGRSPALRGGRSRR